MYFVEHEERLHALAYDERLLSLVRRLLGSDDLTMFQDMALVKPPGGGREKPWHQDNAYFTLPPATPITGAWIALDEATHRNGCMHVIPGSHREGPVIHFRRRDWQICDTDVQTARDVVVPLPPGSGRTRIALPCSEAKARTSAAESPRKKSGRRCRMGKEVFVAGVRGRPSGARPEEKDPRS